jgi:hypothetical protein
MMGSGQFHADLFGSNCAFKWIFIQELLMRLSPLILPGGGGLPWWGILLVTLFTVIVLFVIVKCCIELQVNKILILP